MNKITIQVFYMLQNLFKRNSPNQTTNSVFQTMFIGGNAANWTQSNYEQFAMEGYVRNVVAHRCIAMIARSASFIDFKFGIIDQNGVFLENTTHNLLKVFARPNPQDSCYDLLEKIYSYKLIWGNVFLLVQPNFEGTIASISCLRPDRVTVLSNDEGDVIGYRYKKNKKTKEDYLIKNDGSCNIIHIKSFNPLNDFYGLSAMESAKYSIDQHNEAAKYSKSLLQNSARPSGALVVKATEYNNGGKLTKEQFENLREQLYTQHSGVENNGKPLILEGGLDWKEMSISPRDMDFIENKHVAAREIALAFGVPSQLLGIPGDNTYSNMVEARASLWEQTIIPLVQDVAKTLERGLGAILTDDDLTIQFDRTRISELSK